MKRGLILVETLIGATLSVLIAVFLFQLSIQVWTKEFAATEAFYLAREHLYGNSQTCQASPSVAQTFVSRELACAEPARVTSRFHLRLFDPFVDSRAGSAEASLRPF